LPPHNLNSTKKIDQNAWIWSNQPSSHNFSPRSLALSLSDVRGLLADESILNDTAPATFREYNTEQMLQVQSPGQSHKFLITKFGEVGKGEYLDPRANLIVSFDHIRQVPRLGWENGNPPLNPSLLHRRSLDLGPLALTAQLKASGK